MRFDALPAWTMSVDGGGGQAVVGGERGARVGRARGDGRLDRRPQPLPHLRGPELRAQAAVGGVERGDRGGDAPARGGQGGGGLRVAAGRARTASARALASSVSSRPAGTISSTPTRSLLLKAIWAFCWERNCHVA